MPVYGYILLYIIVIVK